MSSPGQEFVEVFLQEASEHLQFLREYGGILLDPYPAPDDLERLYVAAHTLKGSSGMYGFPLFSEVAAKLAHIFQYAMNVGIGADAANPLVEFISEAVAVLESDLWMISTNSAEAGEDIAAFKAKYPFAFQQAAEEPQSRAEQEVPAEPEPVSPPRYEAEATPVVEQRVEYTRRSEQPRVEPVREEIVPVPAKPVRPLPTTVQRPIAAQIPPVPAESAKPVEPVASSPVPAAPLPAAPLEPQHAISARVVDQPIVPAPVALPAVSAAPVAPQRVPDAPIKPAPIAPQPAVAAVTTPVPQRAKEKAVVPDIGLPPDGDVPEEILEFFVPEVEEHLQTVTECLLALEMNPTDEDIHRLFRAMHTVKGSAAQVGLPRIALVAHRAEDLIGRLRDGALKPSAEIVDVCLESVDTLKKFLYRQWPDEATAQSTTKMLLGRIGRLAPEEEEEEEVPAEAAEISAESVFEVVQPERVAVEVPPVSQQVDPISVETEPLAILELEPPIAAAAIAEAQPLADLIPEVQAVPQAAPVVVPTAPLDIAKPESMPAPIAAPVPEKKTAAPVPTRPAPFPAAPIEKPAAQVIEKPEPRDFPDEVLEAVAPKAALPADVEPVLGLKKEPSAIPQSRSVRIALERLDRMMNAVGELVINRTRMLGRVAELERLADVLNFSKARMSDKITEFQEKYEFSRITGVHPAESMQATAHPQPESFGSGAFAAAMDGFGPGDAFPFRGGYSSYSQKFDASLAEFSELEMDRYDEFSILSRSLTEISADITEILTQLDGFVRRVDSDIDEFTKLAHRLQDEITAARMVPIGNLYTRITRTVRDSAKAVGKQVDLHLTGAETELDNNIIQQIADPLLHLVRNAVAHGIERAEKRYELGKSDNGNLYVRAYHRGNHIYIEVEDDGRGLDYDKIRATAVELGVVSADDADRLGERELQDLLFQPGFSTAPKKTELAGRGVGLDVVKANLTALNGEIEIESQKGFGTRFTLKVPLTLIISQALFVRCGKNVFALPLAFVEEIRRIKEGDVEEVGGKLLTKVRDQVTEVVRLDRQLGLDEIEPLNGYYRLVLVNVAGRQVGIVVEEVLRKDEIVIKNLGEYLRNVKLFPGVTIAPDGSLILMIDVNRLIAGEAVERRPLLTAANAARLFFPGASALASGEVPEAAIEFVPEEKVVVLADDSISVRKFVGRMLEKAGYRVRLACDGLEALEIVSQTRCDLVVTDLEMPRTNGYELMAHMRQNPATKDVPVMVVTSRAGAKHRDKAMKQGAIEFLVKPVQEEQFVAVVARLIGPAKPEMAPLPERVVGAESSGAKAAAHAQGRE